MVVLVSVFEFELPLLVIRPNSMSFVVLPLPLFVVIIVSSLLPMAPFVVGVAVVVVFEGQEEVTWREKVEQELCGVLGLLVEMGLEK